MSKIFTFQIFLLNSNLLSASQNYSTYSQLAEKNDLLSFQRRTPVESRFWSRLRYYYSKRSRPKLRNQLTRNNPSCLAIAVVSKANFLDNHPARVPTSTQNQEETMEVRHEVLSSVGGAQDLYTSSYQVSDLEDIDFSWETSQLEMDAVFRSGIDTPFSPTTFDDLYMQGSAHNPIVLDEQEVKENCPPSTKESVRPKEPPRLQRSRGFGAKVENVPDSVYKNLFQ